MSVVFAMFFAVIYLVILVISIGLAIFSIIGQWKMFEKAGEPGWACLIPFYNIWVMVKIAMNKPILAYILFGISGVSIVLYFFTMILTFFDLPVWLTIAPVILIYALAIPSCVLTAYLHYVFVKSYAQEDIMCVLAIFFSSIIFGILALKKDLAYIGPQGKLFDNIDLSNKKFF